MVFSQGARIGIYCFGLNSKIWKLVNTRGVVKQSGRDGSVLNRSPQWSFYANPHPIRRGLAHATGVHERNMMRTHEIRPSVKCTILMRKHEKKYFCAQSRHTQGTVVARFLESLGTV